MNESNTSSVPVGPWYFSSKYVDPVDATLPFSHPLLQWGWGAFTTGRWECMAFEAGQCHVQRLISHAVALRLQPPTYEEILAQLKSWLSHLTSHELLKIKLSLIAPKGEPVFTAYSFHDRKPQTPVRLITDTSLRTPKISPYSQRKSHAYVDYMLLRLYAHEVGVDDVLLQDEHNFLVETSSAAFWFIDNEALYIPAASLGALESITTATLTTLVAEWLSMNIVQWQGTFESIPRTARCYLSNCVHRVMPVEYINTRRFSLSLSELTLLSHMLQKALSLTNVSPCS